MVDTLPLVVDAATVIDAIAEGNVNWAGVKVSSVKRAIEVLESRLDRKRHKDAIPLTPRSMTMGCVYDGNTLLIRMLPVQVEITRQLARAVGAQLVTILKAEMGLGKSFLSLGAPLVAGTGRKFAIFSVPAVVARWQEVMPMVPNLEATFYVIKDFQAFFDTPSPITWTMPLQPNLVRMERAFRDHTLIVDEYDVFISSLACRWIGAIIATIVLHRDWNCRVLMISAFDPGALPNLRHESGVPTSRDSLLILLGFEEPPSHQVAPETKELRTRLVNPFAYHAAARLPQYRMVADPADEVRVQAEVKKTGHQMNWPAVVADRLMVTWETKLSDVMTHRCHARVLFIDQPLAAMPDPVPATNTKLKMVNYLMRYTLASDPARAEHMLARALPLLQTGQHHVILMTATPEGITAILKHCGNYPFNTKNQEDGAAIHVYAIYPQEALASRSKTMQTFRDNTGAALLVGVVTSLNRGVTLCNDAVQTTALIAPQRNPTQGRQAVGRFQRMGFSRDTEAYHCFLGPEELDLFHLIYENKGNEKRHAAATDVRVATERESGTLPTSYKAYQQVTNSLAVAPLVSCVTSTEAFLRRFKQGL